MSDKNYVFATHLEDLRGKGCVAIHIEGHTIALFIQDGRIFAVDNRCPHMGFPLERGSVKDGILTCHWHHARFDLASGGTFDQWADDVRTFPTRIKDGEVWVDISLQHDPKQHQRERLQVGLERDLSLVLGKAVLSLLDGDGDPVEPFRAVLNFGTRYRWNGWGQGLTMHTCFMNMLPFLRPDDRPRALYHGLSAVARDCFGQAPRFPIRPLPTATTDLSTLKTWFRQFVEVRDNEGAERCIVSAIRAGAEAQQMADMLFAAVTDHRYIEVGHPADFTNKAFEALDIAGWNQAEMMLTSLVSGYTRASRMEEANAWRHPIDLVVILEDAFDKLPSAREEGQKVRSAKETWKDQESLIPILVADNPNDIADSLLEALKRGAHEVELASAVSYAAALRVARFHTSNEFPDWDTALHTFTFANAVEQGLRRAPSLHLLRGVFDAAMSVYLDRFLNIPAAQLPDPGDCEPEPESLLANMPTLLNHQQQVNQAGQLTLSYLHHGGNSEALLAMLGRLLLREDRDFHTIQMVEAAFQQHQRRKQNGTGSHVLVAAARYLAAHSPTLRSQGQTYDIAYRLHRGDRIFEGD